MTFESFAEQHGLIIQDLVHDRWARCATVDKPNKRNGVYIFDGKSGAVRNWAMHEKPIPYLNKDFIPDTNWQVKKVATDQTRLERQKHAANKAAYILNSATKGTHPYLASKGFAEDKKLSVWKEMLIVPMRINQSLVGCQMIDKEGGKRFLSGQITKGAEFRIDAKGRHILCEGLATALSIRKALKTVKKRYTIHVCFSANNILEVAKNYADCMIVADNDPVGIKVAKKTGMPYWVSPVEGEDFNDYEIRVGAETAGLSLIAIGHAVSG